MSLRARLCIALFTPAVLVCLVLTVFQHATGQLGFVHLTVWQAESSDAHPVVRSILVEDAVASSGLRPGDVLLQAGGRSLAGLGPVTFYAAVLETPPEERPVRIEFERDGRAMETRLDVSPANPARERFGLAMAVSLFIVGTLLVLRARDDGRSLLLYVTMQAYALDMLWFPGGPVWMTYGWVVVFAVAQTIFAPMFVMTGYRWTDRTLPGWAFAVPAALSVGGLLRLDSLHEVWLPSELAFKGFTVVNLTMEIVGLSFLVANYIAGDGLERRKLRWLFCGVLVGILPITAINFVILARPELLWMRPWVSFSALIIPFSAFVALARFDFLDVDRVIGVTTSVALLGFLVLAGVLMGVPRAAHALGGAAGVDTGVAQTAFSILIAALAVPVHGFVWPRIDRLLFRERHALQDGIDQLIDDLAASPDPTTLLTALGTRLDELLRPNLCAVYSVEDGFAAAVFGRGRAVPPAVAGDGALARLLSERRGPVGARELRHDPELGMAERASLETVGASILFPVLIGRSLEYVVCLGEKRSGDIYTETDRALLSRVGDRVALELMRFDDAEIVRESRAMQEALRQYVPGAVAERLDAGGTLEDGEREISVLFVDVRGYTDLSQDLDAQEVFAAVNRYTETVSRIARARGGTVVEFNGDGMMVVFGAPEPLEAKESRAVEAAREMAVEVGRLEVTDRYGRSRSLSCGVGIATGPAFLGNIRAVDRYIWSAIGNTTNLAARLEALTRDLDASIVIDTPTYEAADVAVAGFSRKNGVRIRGRKAPQDVFLLPLEA